MRLNKFFLFAVFLLTLFSCQLGFPTAEGELSRVENSSETAEKVSGKTDKTKTLKIVSWNIQHLGKTKSDSVIYEIASLLRNFDLVAVQEVVAKDPAGAQAVARLADALNRMGFQWDYQVSDPTKSPSVYMSERYAFLWKPSRVQMIHRARLDTEFENEFYREPFIGKFKIRGGEQSFYVVNYHSRKYSDKPEEEIVHLEFYPERLQSEHILIAGDFNLNEKHPVWDSFYENGFSAAVSGTRTTLKRSCSGENYLNHAIDNIYFTSQVRKIHSGSIDFVKTCEDLPQARKISDHLPVFMEFSLN